MALFFKKFSCKAILPGCVKDSTIVPGSVKANKKLSSEPKVDVSKLQISPQRISFSDISNPHSPISLHDLPNSLVGSNLHIFTLQELKVITNNFSRHGLLGRGGFGKVYKGFIHVGLRPGLEAQPVAVKVLDLNSYQGHDEWLAEVIFLGQLKHPHLVKLVGYCYEEGQRVLVYEYIPLGNLGNKLFGNCSAPLPWLTRIKIAVGTAKCLAFLHEEVKPVICRDLKSSNILLDKGHIPKLSDFGLAKDGPEGADTHISTRVMGTLGYAAPEYMQTGRLTTKCDVYCFGIVLLELLTGKRTFDSNRPRRERYLVNWARPLLKDFNKLEGILDPRLEGQYSIKAVKKAAALAYRCLSLEPKSRPIMSDVVQILEPLLNLNDISMRPFVCTVSADGNISLSYISNNEEKSEEKEDEKEGNGGQYLNQKGRNQRHRIRPSRSRAVYSDTALFDALGTSLYCPKN